ncbi:MAG: hypothetical protein RLY20_749 [Verrucomicrobiota bacterium]|jgi:hypothetical protein
MKRNGSVVFLSRSALLVLSLLLSVLLLLSTLASGSHCASAHKSHHHDCALCTLVTGGLLADGDVGVVRVQISCFHHLPVIRESIRGTAPDVRFAYGRAPPV